MSTQKVETNYGNLTDDSPKILQPKDININLMMHQLTAIKAMRSLEETGKLDAKNIIQYGDPLNFTIETIVGILADKVGAGKSLMIVELLNLYNTAVERNFFWSGTKYISIQVTKNENLLKEVNTNLLVVPHKLVTQWTKFFELAPKLKVYTYTCIEDSKNLDYNNIKKNNVIIVSCTKTAEFFKKFHDIKWTRVIIDEADTISISTKDDFHANFIWLVTATPKSLRYSNKYFLSNIFKTILPWTFEHLIVKNNPEFVEKSIILDPPKRITIKCLTPKEIKIIQSFIPTNILNMINAGNTEEAIKTLNFNVNTDDNILQVITKNLVEAINNKKLELEYEIKKNVHGNKPKKDKEDRIKKLEHCVKRLETRYESIKEKIHTLNDQYCPICMSEFTNPTLVNCCQSIYCFECITLTSTQNGLCPYCKKKLYKEKMHIIGDKNQMTKTSDKVLIERDKLEILLELIEKNPQGKFLVFANYSQTFEKIEKSLKEKEITYNILKGSQKIVQKTLDNFVEGNCQVIMLNARFFGAGMNNLQVATHLVLYHRFEYDLEEQVIGRAQRLGRTSQLNVFYLIHDNEDNSFNSTTNFEDMNYADWLLEN